MNTIDKEYYLMVFVHCRPFCVIKKNKFRVLLMFWYFYVSTMHEALAENSSNE